MGVFGGNKHRADTASSLEDDYDDILKDLDPTAASGTDDTAVQNLEVQDAIRESLDGKNLDLMRDIVMRIREDPIYACTIYADCPRLQHKLDEHPDLRPIFEDPDLVRINFEQVYREAGGKLPEDEDEEEKKSCWRTTLGKIVNHPLFKVLRFLLLIKKLVGCVSGGGVAMVRGCLGRLCCESMAETALDAGAEGAADGVGDLEGGDAAGDGGAHANPANAANREALNRVAEHMEQPEVSEAMNDLLDNDPEGLQEAIENDPELRELRDSSPLCAELMSDPETMRILVNPDNLRALGECPDLIEADFADPDWTPPDVEAGGGGGVPTGGTTTLMSSEFIELFGDADVVDGGDADLADNVDHDADHDAEAEEEGEEEEEEEEEGLADEYELGEAEGPDSDMNNNRSSAGKGKAKGGAKKSNNRGGGFMAQIGAGITDLVAAELVGASVGDFVPGGDSFPGEDALDDAANNVDNAEAAASTVENANALAEGMDMFGNDDFADNLDNLDNLEDGMDHVEETQEDGADDKDNRTRAATAGAGGAAAATTPVGVGGADPKAEGEESAEQEEEPKKKGRFGFVGGFAAAVSTAAKEAVVGSIFGDDLGELLVEKQEEAGEDGDDDEAKDEGEDKKSKRKGVFGRKL